MGEKKFPKKVQKLIDQSRQYLDNNEVIESAIFGVYETDWMGNKTTKNGAFIATNKKLFFFSKKLTGYESETFPYSKISSFESGKKLMGHYIKFYTSGNKVSMKWIQDSNIGEFINYIKDRIEDAQYKKDDYAGASANSAASSVADELKKLAELKNDGILTEEEFTIKKKQLLNP
ncbi:hypothetical protein HOO54_02660 [Bacillus sp. WMMC1349]|uniref:PH domain-containing protein n=1 Tax=Bacillus sp. WMMC1349 TaxID=2736254 RepID=UPI001552E462|nr:PH domain-containing protein [Bacillus sp. WMMC1349]NPC91181.1 hypothetical protein [Bacillus sp. WMMC1349]